MPRDAALDLREPVRLGVEPVIIAVEHDGDRSALARRKPRDLAERREVSVEAADDVENVGGEIRRTVQRRRPDSDSRRGRCARRDPRPSPQGGGEHTARGASIHSAASFSAPPQLEPWPAVQPKQWPATRIGLPAMSSSSRSREMGARAAAARERQVEHLVEVAVVDVAAIVDRQEAAAHHAVEVLVAMRMHELVEVAVELALRRAGSRRSAGSACWRA